MASESLILFFITAVVLVGSALIFSSLVPPKSSNPFKFEPYECGIETVGESWLQYTVGYYLFAILFLMFEKVVEQFLALALGHALDFAGH